MAATSSIPINQPATDRSAGFRFLIMLLAGFMLCLPLLSIYLLNYDRQSRSTEARASIAEGWGGAQTVTGPQLVIPYRTRIAETEEVNGKTVTRYRDGTADLVIEADKATLDTVLKPERRQRSIYEAIVYSGTNNGTARFVLPDDLAEREIPLDALIWNRAQLRFGLSDVRGLQSDSVSAHLGDKALVPLPGGEIGTDGFYAKLDASALRTGAIATRYAYGFRGNGALALRPAGKDMAWTVKAPWGSPSFKGDFLPQDRKIDPEKFEATWRIGGLSLGGSANSAGVAEAAAMDGGADAASNRGYSGSSSTLEARVELFETVDIYTKVDKATKYGFLFIGFTFVALLMFDVIGGNRVSLIEYLLVGAGLVMFFVLLLAFAEVTGFGLAYTIASAAVIGLITAYSAAVLKSWGRARWIGGLLVGLYAVLFVLLSLEAYALLIGALLLFVALAGVMYLTRNIDWGAKRGGDLFPAPSATPPAQAV
jgi:inner membrane protein